jgi:PadR family transcriptional regulator AphA
VTLEFAILGFLNYQPLSGYDLKKLFDHSVRHFWSADQSQIYRTLARLTDQGLADVTLEEQIERPDRKVYHITQAGREALRQWLSGPFPTESSRSAPLVQVFFSGQLSDEEILAKFQQAAQFFRTILEHYNQVPEQVEEYIEWVDSPRESYFWMLTLELGMKTMQTQLEWAESVIQRLQDKKVPPQ